MFVFTCISLLVAGHVLAVAVSEPKWTDGSLHLPLYRKETRRVLRRDAGVAAIGLGDVLDVTYNVLVEVGGVETPLVLDSGSADLWVISDACTGSCTAGVPLYPHATFQETGMDVHLLYGDSHTGTHAYGPIGKDRAGLATVSVKDQYFAAITDTNTTVLETGSAGIFGIGFPPISILWRQLLQAQLSHHPPAKRAIMPDRGHPNFPTFEFLQPPAQDSHSPYKRQSTNSSLLSSDEVIDSFATYGPLITRIISKNLLARPIVAASLQRDTVDVGGNVGMLSIGSLPAGISDDALTWVPLRAYSVAEGGLPPPPDAPDEVYPLAWEIPLDDVWFNDVRLERSTLQPASILPSALIDTGNSLIRGPQDMINQIQNLIGSATFDCAEAQNLTFQIGGKFFPVDPRDFIHQTFADSVEFCSTSLAVTDAPTPGSGFLYGWSLGDPFMKSVLAAFYYGNLTHPSQDPPRIGLLSTMPSDAAERLRAVVTEARKGNGNFIVTSESAPSGTFIATSTGVGGVPQATRTQPDQPTRDPDASSASRTASVWTPFMIVVFTFCLGLVIPILLVL